MYRILLIWLGKLTQKILRLRGNGGSSLPGLIIEKISPGFLRAYTRRFKYGTVIVTGTNGKTTTAKIIADLLTQLGYSPEVNRTGSNMNRGIISALVEHSTWYGKPRGNVGVFEVDEAFVPSVSGSLKPKVMVVLNLLRDQLDRYGELDRTAQLIKQGISDTKHIVLNADDSLVVEIGKGIDSSRTRYFGASKKLRKQLPDDRSLFGKAVSSSVESAAIRKASSILLKSAKQLEGHQRLVIHHDRGDYEAVLPLNGLYNAYNAAAALATCLALGANFKKAIKHLPAVSPPFGRTERIEIGDKAIELLLVKNPAGFNQIINTFLLEPRLPILMALNDNFADGRDVSWIWDVDFELLAGKDHAVTTSGIRASDLALRLKYAEVEVTAEANLDRALRNFISLLKAGETGYVVPTYTAMLHLRRLLAKKANIKEMWE